MPARRYYIATLPVQHINGKMSPVAVKCSNSADPSQEPEVSYWYGYRHKASPNVSRYGIRSQRRDLSTKPYTAQEDENRTLFTSSLQAVNEHYQIAGDWELCERDFLQQFDYATPRGYAVARCRANGGIWPEEWTS